MRWFNSLRLSDSYNICVSKLTIIGSDNGLSPGQCQAIICTNAGILLIKKILPNFTEVLSEINIFSFNEILLKALYVKLQQFCLGLNVLTYQLPSHQVFL